MTIETVAVTGGNGTVGRAVLANLAERGYETVNCSRGDREEDVADAYVETDLLDAGTVYGALARADADAVAHCGAVPTPERTPGYVTYESNVMGTYHVLEAASALGVSSVCLASSLSALGAGFESRPVALESLPVDETHPLSPSNPYGLAKQVVEVTADGVARRDGAPTVASVRFPWVLTPETVEREFLDANRTLAGVRETGHFHTARNTLFSYLHAADAADLVRRLLEAEFDGHERFFAAAADTTVADPTAEVVAECYPEVPVERSLEGRASLVDTSKARDLLGWEPERSWTDAR